MEKVPHYTVCIRNGEKKKIKAEELTLGDIVELKSGDLVPADIRVLDAKCLKVDNSSLTGVNFINTLRTNFSYERRFGSFFF